MNARLYSLVLRLYPAELRDDFGAEMMQVFLDDIEDSRRRQGSLGIARVWWRSLKEVFRLALPGCVSERLIVVPLTMFLLQAIYLSVLLS